MREVAKKKYKKSYFLPTVPSSPIQQHPHTHGRTSDAIELVY
jgi:hypothetical protein